MRIDFDIFCLNCRYNLRGLELTSSCPECGEVIITTLHFVRDTLPPGLVDELDATEDESFLRTVRDSGASTEAVGLVRACIDEAGSDRRGHCGAASICRAVVQVAIDFNGEKAARYLEDQKLSTGSDVGRIVRALVQHRLVEPSACDSLDDFDVIADLQSHAARSGSDQWGPT